MPGRLHPGQPAVDAALVERLIASQHPQWAGLPVERIDSEGTTNAIWRLGQVAAARLPLVDYGEAAIDVEARWLPQLAPLLPLAIPEPLATGAPEPGGYPFRWSVHRWIDGEPVSRTPALDLVALAEDLAAWLAALHGIDTRGGPEAVLHDLRGAPLAMRDAETRRGLAALAHEIDVRAALAVWEVALRAEPWSRPRVWTHGDLLPGNLLAREGRLAAVIDFAGLGVGDPACDLMIAWGLFSGRSRAVFREALRRVTRLDEATWARGRGHAVHHAAIYIPYYRDTNPAGVAAARRLLEAALDDDLDVVHAAPASTPGSPLEPELSTHRVRIGGVPKEELLAQLLRAGIRLNPMAEALFADPRFTVAATRTEVEVRVRTVQSLGLPEGGTFGQAVERARQQGLALCPLELGPHFRLQHLDQREASLDEPVLPNRAPPGAITVASAPLDESDETPKGLYLRRTEGALWLRGYRSWAGHVLSPQDRLAFVRAEDAG